MNRRTARKRRWTDLYRMEGKAGDRCYTLAHETFMVLDGAQSVAGVVEHANKLLH